MVHKRMLGLVLALALLALVPAARAANIVTGTVLSGDSLGGGPVLRGDSAAAWTEVSRKLVLVRALDEFGLVRTLFSSSAAPGLPKGARPTFAAPSIAAAGGRVAFVRVVSRSFGPVCVPRGEVICAIEPILPAPYSATLLAGRPGSIRAVESTVGRCRGLAPKSVAIANRGLVVDEEPPNPCLGKRGRARIVLRSFSGKLIRVLATAPASGEFFSLVAAGPWAAFADVASSGEEARIVNVGSDRTLVHRKISLSAIAIDAGGEFALSLPVSGDGQCPGDRIAYGTVARPHLRSVVRGGTTGALAVSTGELAFAGYDARCTRAHVALMSPPAGHSTDLPGLTPGPTLAFDGRLISTATGGTIELTSADCIRPTIPVPANEPVEASGPTELISGLYIQGGAAPIPPCSSTVRGPYAGEIIVADAASGVTVATKSVAAGALAHVPLAPGSYKIHGKLAGGASTFASPITIHAGKTLRQDAFLDVP